MTDLVERDCVSLQAVRVDATRRRDPTDRIRLPALAGVLGEQGRGGVIALVERGCMSLQAVRGWRGEIA